MNRVVSLILGAILCHQPGAFAESKYPKPVPDELLIAAIRLVKKAASINPNAVCINAEECRVAEAYRAKFSQPLGLTAAEITMTGVVTAAFGYAVYLDRQTMRECAAIAVEYGKISAQIVAGGSYLAVTSVPLTPAQVLLIGAAGTALLFQRYFVLSAQASDLDGSILHSQVTWLRLLRMNENQILNIARQSPNISSAFVQMAMDISQVNVP